MLNRSNSFVDAVFPQLEPRMPSRHDDSPVPEPTSNTDATDRVANVSDLPATDADHQADDVRGGAAASNFLKTNPETTNDSISNLK
jgi:hypothetical protein